MEKYMIEINGSLTSYVFYNEILSKLHNYYLDDNKQKKLVFDFSLVNSIDPLVIPNLLCIGYIIKETSNYTPELYIPNNIKFSELKRYLNEINFINLAETFNLYDFDVSVKAGWKEQGMDKLNTTMYFEYPKFIDNDNVDDSKLRDSIDKAVTYKFNRFFNKFLSYYNNYNTQTNVLLELSKEIIENSIIHGNSFSFATIQYNYNMEKVYLSFSDCGQGFYKSFYHKINDSLFEPKLDGNIKQQIRSLNSELDGILLGVYFRYGESFGLYDAVIKVLSKNGTVRIHSNDSQIILTSNSLVELNLCKNERQFLEALKKKKNTIRNNLKYQGTHIEIELPISRGEITSNGI